MKRDLSTPLLDLEGKPIPRVTGGDEGNATMRDITQTIAHATIDPNTDKDGKQRDKAFAIAVKLATVSDGWVELESSELEFLKQRANDVYPSPIVRGLYLRFLETDPRLPDEPVPAAFDAA